MPEYQAYNKKTKAWVKYHWTEDGVQFTNVKQKEPTKPFKGIPKRGKRKR